MVGGMSKAEGRLGKYTIPFIITINSHDYVATKIKTSMLGFKHTVRAYHSCEGGYVNFIVYGFNWCLLRIVEPDTIDFPNIGVYNISRHPLDY